MFRFYTSKLHPACHFLWQKPCQGEVFYADTEWYERRRVGHHTLESLMKTLINNASLECKMYTNHSIRATVIGMLDDKGFEARHITAISSHKNESTIKTYSKKCPEEKKKEMYDALNEQIIPKKSKKQASSTLSVPQMQSLGIEMQSNENTNNNNNKFADINLPANFQLVQFETDDDDLLLKYINDNLIDEPQPRQVQNTSTSNTVMANSMPVIPKMYFPNSNVTFNYNFSK